MTLLFLNKNSIKTSVHYKETDQTTTSTIHHSIQTIAKRQFFTASFTHFPGSVQMTTISNSQPEPLR